jgi:hypothetical protein
VYIQLVVLMLFWMLIIKATIILIGPAQLHMNIVVHAPPAYDLAFNI